MLARSYSLGDELPTDYLHLLEKIPTDGRVKLSLQHHGHLLASNPLDYSKYKALAVIDSSQTIAVGLVGLVQAGLFRKHNDEVQTLNLGILSSVRRSPSQTSGLTLKHGLCLLDEICHECSLDALLALVMEDNSKTLQMLKSHRRKHLVSIDLGRLNTLVLSPQRLAKLHLDNDQIEIDRALPQEAQAIVNLSNQPYANRLICPLLSIHDLSHAFNGLSLSDFFVARSKGKVVAALAIWDQRSFRTWKVSGYHGLPEFARYLVNGCSILTGKIPLPKPGSELPYVYAAFCGFNDGYELTATHLLSHASRSLLKEKPAPAILIGLSQANPLCQLLAKYASCSLSSSALLLIPQLTLPQLPEPLYDYSKSRASLKQEEQFSKQEKLARLQELFSGWDKSQADLRIELGLL